MASHVDEINREVEGLASRGKTGQVRKSVLEKCSLVSDEMRDAIMAFQFYDKLVQRLDHVCLSVDGLAELVSDRGRLFLPDEWVSLQDRIRSKYTMEEERLMFEAILQGSTIQQALENFVKAMEARSAQSGNDDVELF
jgi:hypothetical protein